MARKRRAGRPKHTRRSRCAGLSRKACKSKEIFQNCKRSKRSKSHVVLE